MHHEQRKTRPLSPRPQLALNGRGHSSKKSALEGKTGRAISLP
jgi:hypothetical protein